MADFDYVAIDPAGKERKGSVKADSLDEARVKLDARKLFVVRLEPGAVSVARKRAGLSLRAPKLSAKELTLFTRQLSTLIQVSPLEESLRTISSSFSSRRTASRTGVRDTPEMRASCSSVSCWPGSARPESTN